ncbi:glycoside hydrolase family 16 protein [Paraflavisolibacter sp. H34]|uniref:glycoside hydrolase family 16 protein n=1 Tax=Huijunlia imazamoxiresistens TaxID=3127457 RepID=UPI003018C778
MLSSSSFPPELAGGDRQRLVFFENFSGPFLDRSRWNVLQKGVPFNNELQAYVDSPLTVSLQDEGTGGNRVLALTPRYAPGYRTVEGHGCDFLSGRIDTRGRFQFVHGTASARIRLCPGAGLWQAWWLLGVNEYPHHGEVDIIEYVGEQDWASLAAHGSGFYLDSPFVQKLFFAPGQSIADWHTYSVDCTPERLVFRIDDRVQYELTRKMVERVGKWSFDEEKFLVLNLAVGGNYPYYTNKAETPYRGLPADTLALIREGRCAMLVDWVKVSEI